MTRPATTEDQTSVRRKSTLFCWGCDHESPADDDWLRRTRDRHVEVVCPVCETTIAKRPRSDRTARERPTTGSAIAWRRTLRTTVHVWRASVEVGLSSVAVLSPFRTVATGQQ